MNPLSSLINRNTANKKFIPKTKAHASSSRVAKPRKHETLVIFLISLAINLSVAYLLNFVWVIGEVDALSTTANGFITLYAGNAEVIPVTLVKPPLTGLLQLAFIPILKLFGLSFFAGPLLTTIFSALSLIFLNLILLQFDVPPRFRWLLLGLTQITPVFLYTAATGTTEAVFLFVTLFVLWGALQITRNNMSFLICGFGLAVGFFVKYEALALTLGVILALVIFEWRAHENWRSELEGRLIAFITPIVYVVALWLIFNGMNMDDSFYFIKHLFSPVYAPAIARNASVFHPLFLGWDNLFEAFRIGLQRIWQSSLLFAVGAVITFLLALTGNRKRYFSVLIMIISLPLMMILKIFFGLQTPYFYLWGYTIPFGMILSGMLFDEFRPGKRWIFILLTIIISGVSLGLSVDAMGNEGVSYSEQRVHALLTGDLNLEKTLRESDPYWVYRHDAPLVAAAVDQFAGEGTILVNAADASPIALFSQQPEQMIFTAEIDLDSFFSYPGTLADHVLLRQLDEPLNSQYTPQDYPALAEANVDYAKQVWFNDQTVLDWRIFEIIID